MQPQATMFRPRLPMRKKLGSVVYVLFLLATMVGIVGLVVLLAQVIAEGAPWLNWDFLNSYPSRHPEQAGIKSALWGSVWLMGLDRRIRHTHRRGRGYLPRRVRRAKPPDRLHRSQPFQPRGRAFHRLWLAGAVAVRAVDVPGASACCWRRAMTMALLVMPIVILASREAIRAVPDTYRQAGYALGAEKWQVRKGHRAAAGAARHTHRHDTRHVPRARRSGACHRHQRAGLSDIRPRAPDGAVHRAAHTDIQLDIAPAGRVPRHSGGRHSRAAGRAAYDERGGNNSERPLSGEVGCLATLTAAMPPIPNGNIVLHSDDVSVTYGDFRAPRATSTWMSSAAKLPRSLAPPAAARAPCCAASTA